MRPCNNPETCLINNCELEHTVSACQNWLACQQYTCQLRHAKNRTRPCRGGSRCSRIAAGRCSFLHPMNASDKVGAGSLLDAPARSEPKPKNVGDQSPLIAAPRPPRSVPADYQAPSAPPQKQVGQVSSTRALLDKGPTRRQQDGGGNGANVGKCKFPETCFNGECLCSHTVQRCPAWDTCGFWKCSLRHSQQRRRSCKSGAFCRNRDDGCAFFHPPKPVCRYGAKCLHADTTCMYLHPAMCTEGNNCPERMLCKMRHPRSPVEALLRTTAPKGLGALFKEVQVVRAAHNQKMLLAKEKLMRSLALPPEDKATEAVKKEVMQTIKEQLLELQVQQDYFDNWLVATVRSVSERIVETTVAKHRIQREIFRLANALPALSRRAEVEALLVENQFLVVKGETGSGKSTQLPQYIQEWLPNNQKVICTQPRKVSAVSLSERVAFEWAGGVLKENQSPTDLVGYRVGYHVGSMKKSGRHTRIEYLTEGTFLGCLLALKRDKSFLNGVGAIIIDEAHERSINCDIILGLLKNLAKDEHYLHVKIIITSATLDTQLFSRYYDNCPIVSIPGRTFPVEVVYRPLAGFQLGANANSSTYVLHAVKTTMDIHNQSSVSEGDILCFLTGQDEVERAIEMFTRSVPPMEHKKYIVLPLYGKQLPEDQAHVFQKPKTANTRKIVFATDVAETGITIDGIKFCVDTGLGKESTYDAKRNVTILQVNTICKSSAVQRKGRAGRTAPGTCYRLYSQEEFESMHASQTAEVLSRPLGLTLTNLISMGITDPQSFDWIEKPPEAAVQSSLKDLMKLNAIEPLDVHAGYDITEFGRLVALLQIDPRLARMIYVATQRGYGRAGCTIAALFSVANSLFWRGGSVEDKKEAFSVHASLACPLGDVTTMYRIFEDWQDVLRGGPTAEPELDAHEALFEEPAAQSNGTALLKNGAVEHDEFYEEEVLIIGGGLNALFNAEIEDSNSDDTEALEKESEPDSDEESVFSSTTEATVAETARIEIENKRLNRRSNQQAVKQWCRERFLNNKSLQIARTLAEDFIRLLRSFNEGLLWSAKDQEATPSNECLNSIVLSGLFLNTALQIRKTNNYRVLRHEESVVGVIHPGSSLCKLGQLTEHQYLVFFDLFTSSRTFLCVCIPVKREELQAVAGDEFLSANEHGVQNHLIEFKDVMPAMIQSLFGRGEKKRLEDEFSCQMQFDERRRVLEVWTLSTVASVVQEGLGQRIAIWQERANQEVEEEEICGTTRMVYQRGYEGQQLLFDDEFLSLVVRGFEEHATEGDVAAVVSKCAPPQYLEVSYSHKEVVAFVRYALPTQAQQSFDYLQGELVDGNRLVVMRGGICPPPQLVTNHSQLIMSWATAPSSGEGYVEFRTAQAANKLLYHAHRERGKLSLPMIGQVQVTAVGRKRALPTAEIGEAQAAAIPAMPHVRTCAAGEQGQLPLLDEQGIFVEKRENCTPKSNVLFRVRLEGINPTADEQGVLQAITAFLSANASSDFVASKPCEVYILRPDSLETVGDTVSNTADLTNVVSEISRGTQVDSMVMTSFFDARYQNRAGFYLEYQTPEEVDIAYANWLASPILGTPYYQNQPIRLQPRHSTSLSIHRDLWCRYSAEFKALISRLKLLEVSVLVKDAKPAVKVPRVTITLSSPKLPQLQDAVQQFETTLEAEIYQPSTDQERLILFSIAGRHLLQHISDSITYVHWDKARCMVSIYGQPEQRAIAMEAIKQDIQSAALQQVTLTVNINSRKRRDVIQAWKETKRSDYGRDVVAFRVNYSTSDVSIVGTAEGVQSVAGWLAQFAPPESNGRKADSSVASQKHRNAKAASEEDDSSECCLCYGPIENIHHYSGCKHMGCRDCLANQFSTVGGAERDIFIPICCGAMNCSKPIALRDIRTLASSQAVSVIKDIALNRYLQNHRNEFRYCPNQGCTQILRLRDAKTVVATNDNERDAEEARNGGKEVISCNECKATYCLHCSYTSNKAVSRHCGDTCEEKISGATSNVREHYHHITTNLLTLQCPHCQTAFLDFDGCCAVTCSTCKKHFCGLCLDGVPGDAHRHVGSCRLNPNDGDYFASEKQLNNIHRTKRINAVKQYLQRSVPQEMRSAVLDMCTVALAEVNIRTDQI